MDGLPVLCVLGLLCSLGMAVDKTLPPEDLDGSGDDEDFSGSGLYGSVSDLESEDITVHSTTSDSTLVPTVEGSTAAQEPEIVDKEETKMEDTTKSAETTKTPNAIIEDLFAFDTVAKAGTTQEATTSPFQQTTTAGLIEEIDTKKHHHHHHHHPHHHTTTSSTLPSASAGHNDNTTDVPPEVVKPHDLPEKMATSSPHEESNLHSQELTTPVEHLTKDGVLHEETTSGSTSNSTDNEGAVEAIDADHLPGLDSFVTSTVTEDSHTHTDHHHHHHPHPLPHTTTSLLDGSDVQQEVTTVASDLIEHEDNVGEPTTAAEDGHHHGHPHHGHPHHTHHHKTTPSSPRSTEPEKPDQVHTHEPKGRRVQVPDVKSTTAVPVINEEVSEDAENDLASSTVVYNVSRNPFDEEASDSKEEGSTGGIADEDIYLEETDVVNKGRMMPANPPTDEGTHGIMERKELLAGIIAGGVAGLVFAGFLVAFVLYRMKKKDEGSYSLEETKQSNGGYQKPREQREFYA